MKTGGGCGVNDGVSVPDNLIFGAENSCQLEKLQYVRVRPRLAFQSHQSRKPAGR